MAEKTEEQWERIIAEALTGYRSIRSIAAANDVSEGAIRKRLKRMSGTEAAAEIKRRMVKTAVALGGEDIQHASMARANEMIALAVDQDVADMNKGAELSRQILGQIGALLSGMEDPRDLKVAADTVKTAIETIRKIRGLDDAEGRDRNEFEHMSDEELLNEFERLKSGSGLTPDSVVAGTA